jgi:AraC family transcriptional regulator
MLNLRAGKFLTEVLHSKATGDLVFAETFYTSGQIIEQHSHKQAGFIFILNGEFLELYDKRKRVCKSADVIFRPAGQLHGDHFKSPSTRCFNMQFGMDWISRLQRITGDFLSEGPGYFSAGVLFHLGLKLYKEFRLSDLDSPLIMEGLALEMLGETNRLLINKGESLAPPWLKKVQEQLHSHFTEQLSVQTLSMEVGVHPVYLNRVFRKHYGQSIGEYLRMLRMEFCATQLASTSMSIADISAAAGFYDQSHFSRIFKRLCGISPLAYRRCFRKV